MNLGKYFEGVRGRGVLATANSEGHVDVAIYAKPHFMDEETVAFIMADRLTHHHLESNPHAAYLFIEDGRGYKGIRLFLTKLREEKDSDLLYSIRSSRYPSEKEEGKPRFLVLFRVDKTLPLVGPGNSTEEGEGVLE
jgi:Pyridoxamine 5'-phosphate oxidase